MFDPTKFLYLKAVVDSNFNITKAANALYVTQPALSKVLKQLESEFNIQLFKRKKNKITSFTTIGEYYYLNFLELYKDYLKISNNLKLNRNGLQKTFVIGIHNYLLDVLIEPYFDELISEFPNVCFQIIENNVDVLYQSLEKEKCDIVISLQARIKDLNIDNRVEVFQIGEQRYNAFVGINHPLAKEETLSLMQIVSYPLLIPSPNNISYQVIVNMLNAMHLPYTINTTATSWRLLLKGVLNDTHIAILPKNVSTLTDTTIIEKVKSIPLKEKILWKPLLLYKPNIKYSKDTSNYKLEIINFLLNKIKEHMNVR